MQRGHRDGAKTRVAIREAALTLFSKHGYEATTLRAIASAVDIQVGSLYNHISGKEELLTDIMMSVLDTLESQVYGVIDTVANDRAIDRLVAALSAHIRHHAQHAKEISIGQSELRSLPPASRRAVNARHDAYEAFFKKLIVEAAEERGIELLNLKLQTYAILALGMHTATWYRPRGELSLDEVVEISTELCLRQLGMTEQGRSRG